MQKVQNLQIFCNILVPALLLFAGLSLFLADTFQRSTRYQRNIQALSTSVPSLFLSSMFLYFWGSIPALLWLWFSAIVTLLIWQESRISLGWLRKFEIKEAKKRSWNPQKYYRSIGFVLFMWGTSIELFRQVFVSMIASLF